MNVLDASALLAFLHEESGGELVATALKEGLVSTVNWAEVIQKAMQQDVPIDGMATELQEIGVSFVPFSAGQAELAASLWQVTRGRGLSLADRACLALAIERNARVYTADRVWADLELDLEIQLLR